MGLRFEWDDEKAVTNLRKHGVDFHEAHTVFFDPLALIFQDEGHSIEERREIIVGHSAAGRLLLVSFTERTHHAIRLISARPMNRREVEDYEKKTGG